jgi:DNA polymerase/3'-5' exonuclease PolX
MFTVGNNNGALVYRKAAAAIRDLDYQVTDGKALTRPKTKVAGIGKKIGDLITAFLQTGEYTYFSF